MTAIALVAGTVFRTPERRTAKTGKPYVVATICVRDGDATQFWRVTIFSESAGDETLRLSDGDAVSVQGAMQAELYRPEGKEPRISLSIIADQVLPLRTSRKARGKGQDAGSESGRHSAAAASGKPLTGRRSPNAPHGWHDTDGNADAPPF